MVLDGRHYGLWSPLYFYIEYEYFQTVSFSHVEGLVDVWGGFGPYHYGIETSLPYIVETSVVIEFCG